MAVNSKITSDNKISENNMNDQYINKNNKLLWVIIIMAVILGAYWFGLKQQPQTEFDACYNKCMDTNQDERICIRTCSPQ